MRKKNKPKKMLGPVITMMLLTIIVILSSSFFSLLEIDAEKTEIVRGSLETSLITVKNVLTKDGVKYIFNNIVTNLQIFEPLFLLIISLTAIGIGEASGLFKAIFEPMKKINNKFLTFLTLLVGIVSSFFGDYSYVFLLPMVAILYQYLGRKPLLGILTIFIGITMGYGTGFIYNYDEIIISGLTEKAASLDVDKNFVYLLKSNIYIMFFSTLILSIVGTSIIHTFLDKKVPKSNIENDDKLIVSKKGLRYSNIAFIIMSLIIIFMIIPGQKSAGFLLGEGNSYVEKLLGPTSPFISGLSFILLIIIMVCSFIYGKISGNIKNSNEYSVGLSKNFENLGYVFVLLFFMSLLVSIFEWTNLGQVICSKIIELITILPFSGLPVLITFFVGVILMTILIPSVTTKWELASPLMVPLLMKSNITPNFTQFVFRTADGIGKCFTPLFPYYIITLAFLEKYNTKENNKITVFGTLKMIMPTLLLFTVLWLVIILSWHMLGIPLGPETYSIS
ncbi:MAG: AbgT family transporter [Bacilli bacterium]